MQADTCAVFLKFVACNVGMLVRIQTLELMRVAQLNHLSLCLLICANYLKSGFCTSEMAVFGRFSSMFNISETKSAPAEDIPFVVPRRPSRVSLLSRRSKEERSLIESLNLELYVSTEGDEYFYGENHIGRIWFEIEFDAEREKLFVWMDKVRNLPCRSDASPLGVDRLRDSNDFFLRVYLSPFGDKCFAQTKTRRRTLNPKFDELFTFELSPVHFDERCLKIVAYRVDAFKRIMPVGHVLYPLSQYTVKKKKHLTVWRDFQKDETEHHSLSSELHCSLVYNDSIERLTLTISQVRDLELYGSPESWGKFTLHALIQWSYIVCSDYCPTGATDKSSATCGRCLL
uniref:C2 domain-containing protein n=1 Tax=Trichuris muris TaxID=70415 RepID=A0A5S6QP89_TRIMR